MKRFVLFTVLALGLVSCSACGKKVPEPVVVDAQPTPPDAGVPDSTLPAPTTTTFTFLNMEATLPGTNWEQKEFSANVAGAKNDETKTIVVLGKDASTETLEAFTLEAIRGEKSAGATVLSVKQVTLNGHKFALIQSVKGSLSVWTWVTTEAGFGYNLSCGGMPGINQHDLCAGVADTLRIN